MVRMPFLLKALRNILEGRCMKPSMSLTQCIIKGYNDDMQHLTSTRIDDIDDDQAESPD